MSKQVIVRSNMSGVWFGTLMLRGKSGTVTLTKARRLWSWENADGTGSCSVLALTGPGKGSRIDPEVPRVVIGEFVEIIDASEAAIKVFAR